MTQHVSDDLYRRFRDLLARRAGLHYPEAKRADLVHGLALALQATELHSLDALYAAAHDDGRAWETLIAHLTIGETYFFRHAAQFEVLRRQILPELIAQRAKLRTLRIWSAGCATGEEPYSIAMLLHELLPEPETWHVTILATDINARFLERARAGLYGAWSFREEAAAQRERFFTPEQGRWRLRPEIRRMVTFAPLNLAVPGYPSVTTGTCALDLIMCRNVTIYFDEATTRQIAERFFEALLPGGWLLVGHAEPHATTYRQFQVHNLPDAILYRKALDAPGFVVTKTHGAADGRLHHQGAGISHSPHRSRQLDQQDGNTLLRPPAVEHAARLVPPSYPNGAETVRDPATDRPGAADERLLWADIRRAFQASDVPTIERLGSTLLRIGADRETVLLRLARIAADHGSWKLAEQYGEQALAHNALSARSHLLLARIHAHQNRLDAALDAYRRVLYLDSTLVVAMVEMASVWSNLGRTTEAERSYRAAIHHLAMLHPHAAVSDADGATVNEVRAFAQAQLQTLAVASAKGTAHDARRDRRPQ